MIFTVTSELNGKTYEPEIFGSLRELTADLYVSAMPDYRRAVLRWADKPSAPLVMMNGNTRETWVAKKG